MQVTLSVISGPYTGQAFTFDRPDRFLVGRSEPAHFRLLPETDKDRRVSRVHFLIEVNPPLCRLFDLNSRNGTHVNGERVRRCDLEDGDEIRAGQTVLRVTIQETPTAEAAIPPKEPTYSFPPAPPAVAAPTPFTCPVSLPVEEGPSCLCCSTGAREADSPICAECRQRATAQPQPIPAYLLLRPMGKGGMGMVHLALRRLDRQLVAVKTIRPNVSAQPGLVDRFLREAKILRELRHKYIVSFHELGEAGGQLYFAMDYVIGTDASRFLKENGPLHIRPAVRIILQVLQALDYAHSRQFVHRDIKPSNILLEKSNQRLRSKVADFGLARIYQGSRLSGLTQDNQVGGSLPFMPPEQITSFRDVQPAADQYSAAATLYNLLTGQFIMDLKGDFQKKMRRILNDKPVPIRQRRPDLPEELAEVIHRALAREPNRRYPSVAHLRRELRPFAG